MPRLIFTFLWPPKLKGNVTPKYGPKLIPKLILVARKSWRVIAWNWNTVSISSTLKFVNIKALFSRYVYVQNFMRRNTILALLLYALRSWNTIERSILEKWFIHIIVCALKGIFILFRYKISLESMSLYNTLLYMLKV